MTWVLHCKCVLVLSICSHEGVDEELELHIRTYYPEVWTLRDWWNKHHFVGGVLVVFSLTGLILSVNDNHYLWFENISNTPLRTGRNYWMPRSQGIGSQLSWKCSHGGMASILMCWCVSHKDPNWFYSHLPSSSCNIQCNWWLLDFLVVVLLSCHDIGRTWWQSPMGRLFDQILCGGEWSTM